MVKGNAYFKRGNLINVIGQDVFDKAEILGLVEVDGWYYGEKINAVLETIEIEEKQEPELQKGRIITIDSGEMRKTMEKYGVGYNG